MQSLDKLVKGYKSFIKDNFQNNQGRYRSLAENGQAPRIMMIGCCDSRVNPDLIFNTRPGDLFVVRNVANLVPPFEPDGGHHGTSAAIEFAVTVLNVEHIVVMGHSLCGGVRACCEHAHGNTVKGLFIPQWTSILSSCTETVKKRSPHHSIEDFSRDVEMEGVKFSLSNLRQFPFIQERIESNTLHIHGAYFEIKEAQLYALDYESDHFIPIE